MPLLSLYAFWLTAFFLKPETQNDAPRLAPEFPKVAAERWLNSPPLKMADLRGKVILLDVWTFM